MHNYNNLICIIKLKKFSPTNKIDENIIVIELGEFPLMMVLKQHSRIDDLLTLILDSKEIVIHGYNTEEVQMLANTIIPISSFKSYRCQRNLPINVPMNVNGMNGKCERIEVFEEDSWRVTAKFKFSDGDIYQINSHTMSERRDVERLKPGVSFTNYFHSKRTLNEYGRHVDVLVKDGIASFRTGNKRFKYVYGEEDGKLYCKFKTDNLKPLNKFLDLGLKGYVFKFSNESENYLFSIEAKDHRTDVVLKRFTYDYGYMKYLYYYLTT